jgi:hypothetical protein
MADTSTRKYGNMVRPGFGQHASSSWSALSGFGQSTFDLDSLRCSRSRIRESDSTAFRLSHIAFVHVPATVTRRPSRIMSPVGLSAMYPIRPVCPTTPIADTSTRNTVRPVFGQHASSSCPGPGSANRLFSIWTLFVARVLGSGEPQHGVPLLAHRLCPRASDCHETTSRSMSQDWSVSDVSGLHPVSSSSKIYA